jgi:hypothetical protein
MFLDLLHFVSVTQAINYFIFCLAAIFGTIQGVAVHYNRSDLYWFEGRFGYTLSAAAIIGSFIWFFATDKEIFIPGLAGGEFFTLFVSAFAVAVPITRVVAWIAARVRAMSLAPKPTREKEPLL